MQLVQIFLVDNQHKPKVYYSWSIKSGLLAWVAKSFRQVARKSLQKKRFALFNLKKERKEGTY